MKRIISALTILAMTIACATAETYTVKVENFSAVNVVDNINVDIVFDTSADAGTVTFECTPEKAGIVLISNDKETLKIQTQSDGTYSQNLPTVTVHATMLSAVTNSGDSTVTVTAPPSAAELSFKVIGNGTIVARDLHATVVSGKIDTGKGRLVLSGVTNWLKLRTVGTGVIEAGGLHADKANIFMSGTGNVDCQVASELVVTGLSSGKVYCKGKPKIKNRTLGSVKVIEAQ